jgi:hypothetical protein
VITKDINAAAIAATSGDITFTFSNKHYLYINKKLPTSDIYMSYYNKEVRETARLAYLLI